MGTLIFNFSDVFAKIQLILEKFHSLTRIQDQLIRIVYAYHIEL